MYDGDVPDGWQTADRQKPGRLRFMAGWGWIVRGWRHYQANPVAWTLAVVCWFLLILALQLPMTFAQSLPFFLPMLANLLGIILPFVLMGGLMLGCRAQDEGDDFSVKHLFAGFSQQAGGLLMVGVIYLGITFLLGLVGALLFFLLSGQSMQTDTVEVLAGQDILMSLVFVLVFALAFVSLLMAIIFAPALVALDGLGAWQAIKLSFRGSMANLMPLTLHGFVATMLVLIGAIPAGLGWLIVLPMLIASIYVAYDEIFHAGE